MTAAFQNSSGAEVPVKLTESGSVPVKVTSESVIPLPAGAAQDGVDGTDITAPTGGSGIRGWLSGIYNRLAKGVSTAANSLSVAQASDNVFAVSGSTAAGAAPTAPPLSVSGVDDGGLKRHLRVDSAGNVGVFGAASRGTITATISNGASVTGTVDLLGTAFVGFIAPAAWTAAALNIEVSTDGTNWSILYDAYGSATGSLSALVAGAAYAVDVVSLLPFRYVRLRSGISGSPVNQGAQRDFKICTRALA